MSDRPRDSTQNLHEMRAYAVMVGTPAALTKDVKATGEAKIVQSKRAATTCIIMMAFLGSFLAETVEIQPEKGRTPSRATAQINREDATPATDVFFDVSVKHIHRRQLTSINPRMQMTFMKTCPPRPSAMEYNCKKGCGVVLNELKTSKLGVQNKNRITTGKPSTALATALEKIPLALVTLAFCVSSLTWPLASNPTRIPAVTKKLNIQFHTGGAPVWFSTSVNTNFASWNP
jgi:hypothetical protein